jgi:hypothetical protein
MMLGKSGIAMHWRQRVFVGTTTYSFKKVTENDNREIKAGNKFRLLAGVQFMRRVWFKPPNDCLRLVRLWHDLPRFGL